LTAKIKNIFGLSKKQKFCYSAWWNVIFLSQGVEKCGIYLVEGVEKCEVYTLQGVEKCDFGKYD
jgi:hypothetical protein